MTKPLNFRGIVAVGSTQSQAVSRYRSVASGKNAEILKDEGDTLALATFGKSLSTVFNPFSGDMDLVAAQELAGSLNFQSESSSDERSVNYALCSDGCGLHIVSDSVLQYCPSCTAMLSMSGDDEAESEDSDEESDEEDSDEAGDDESAEDSDSEEDSGEDADEEDDEGDEESEEETESKPDPIQVLSSDDQLDLDADEDVGEETEDLDSVSSASEPITCIAPSFRQAAKMFARNAVRPMVSASSAGGKKKATRLVAHAHVCTDKDACGMKMIATQELKRCPSCSSALENPDEADLEELNASYDDQAGDEDESDMDLIDDSGDDDEGDDIEVSESGEDCGDEGDTDEDSDEEDEEDEVSESSAGAKTKKPVKASKAKKQVSTSSGDATTEGAIPNGADDLTEEDLDPTDEDAVLQFDATEAVPDDAEADDLDVMYGQSSGTTAWYATHKGVPVARVLKTEASADLQEVFDKPKFGQIVHTAAKHSGVKSVLKELGFKPIVHQVSVSSAVARCVESSIAGKQQELETERKQFRDTFKQCLATASVGMTRGFFHGSANPLRDMLVEALSSAGVGNAEVLVDNVFAKTADNYHAALIDKAEELMSKPAEVRDSLAQTVLACNFQAVSSSERPQSGDDRIASMGRVATREPKEVAGRSDVASHSSADDWGNRMSTALSSLGRGRR